MIRVTCLIILAFIVASCGVKRPLIRPKDIPAYELQQREKRERLERDEQELKAIDAAAQAPDAATEPAK